jgi:rhodanese-related sulfurtransferase
MRNSRFLIHLTIMTSFFLLVASFNVLAASVTRMTTDELKTHLGEANYLVLDVRTGSDWSGSTEKVAGAERADPKNVNQWIDNYDREKTIVLYCS